MVGNIDRRGAIKMSIQTKLRFQKLKEKYEELTQEELREEEFLNVLMDIYEKNEKYSKMACLDNMIEEFISKLKILLSEHPKTFQEMFKIYQELEGRYETLKEEYYKLKEEKEKLEKELERLKQSQIMVIEKMTERQLYWHIVSKVVEKIKDEEIRKDVEDTLMKLGLILFKGDNINLAGLKKIAEALTTVKYI